MAKIRVSLSLAAALVAALVACSSKEPTAPVAVATPTPTPTPTATPSPAALRCNLPAMPECSPRGGPSCCDQLYDVYGEFVVLAIQQVQKNHPELFDGDKIRDPREANHIVSLVARELEERHGFCVGAGNPVEDEVAIKKTNDFNEQFDIIIGDGVGVNIHGYTVTCRPSRF